MRLEAFYAWGTTVHSRQHQGKCQKLSNNDIRYLSKDDSKFLSIKGWLIPVTATIEKSDRPLFFPLYLTLGFPLKAFLRSALLWFPCQSPGTLFLGEENSPSFIPSGCSSEELLVFTVAVDINAIPEMERGKLAPSTGCWSIPQDRAPQDLGFTFFTLL